MLLMYELNNISICCL